MNDKDCQDTDDDVSKYKCPEVICDCQFDEGDTHVGIDLWLSGDYKFLLLVSGLKQANSDYACLYCKSTKAQRHNFLQGFDETTHLRKSDDPVDPNQTTSGGQVMKNLFHFIPKERVILDTLHLLLRCTERLVHSAILLFLQLLGTNLDKDEKKLLLLNKTVAPIFARASGKGRVSFSPPTSGGKTMWTLTTANGTMYRKLLEKFKFMDVIKNAKQQLSDHNKALVDRYQACWDEFKDIYKNVNSAKPGMVRLTKGKITKWFTNYVAGRVTEDNTFLFTTEFILTPYFHCLLWHIPHLLDSAENLRQFCGQSFERRNNEHRLFWQNSNKVKGVEIPSILNQDLRNCMNPMARTDQQSLWHCPASLLCSHKPFTYKKSFDNHLRKKHDGMELTLELQAKCVDEAHARVAISHATHREYAREVVEAFTTIHAAENLSKKNEQDTNRKVRRQFHKALCVQE